MSDENLEKKKALEIAMSQIEKQFGKGAVMRLGENMGMNVQDISSPAFRISVCVMVVATVLSAVLWKLWRKRHEKVG